MGVFVCLFVMCESTHLDTIALRFQLYGRGSPPKGRRVAALSSIRSAASRTNYEYH